MTFKSPDYHVQRDSYSCGPIAILNAIKWAVGENVNDESILAHLRRVTDCRAPGKKGWANFRGGGYSGVLDSGMHQGLISRPEFDVVKRYPHGSFSVKNVKRHLREGNAVILSYKLPRKQGRGHMVLVDRLVNCPVRGKGYSVVGEGHSGSMFFSNKQFQKLLYASKRSITYSGNAWVIRRAT